MDELVRSLAQDAEAKFYGKYRGFVVDNQDAGIGFGHWCLVTEYRIYTAFAGYYAASGVLLLKGIIHAIEMVLKSQEL